MHACVGACAGNAELPVIVRSNMAGSAHSHRATSRSSNGVKFAGCFNSSSSSKQGLSETRQIQPLYFSACSPLRRCDVCRTATAHPIPLFPNAKLIPR
ncbi:hypothetical protein Bcep18194_B2940 [Burkholderia lata]|uniref:Uncharacterized protein n=1 Tax=Burkholderia lata (strain ATCC 17760 / DSM 23089 / LMG 22485 / NCIMB 9086 / R18194 / 383) TaxID=482957 RepID=Q390R5_BURL3|nr:hypothetical protein Bcep18194_B2940 [Burkholderia lata]